MTKNDKVQIETIRIIETAENFGIYFKALYYFDAVINGKEINENINKINYKIMDKFIKHKLRTNGFQNK